MRSLRIICPTAHVAFAPTRDERFWSGGAARLNGVADDFGGAINLTICRLRSGGNPGDPDPFGAQQYAPLPDLEVPGEQESTRWPSWT